MTIDIAAHRFGPALALDFAEGAYECAGLAYAAAGQIAEVTLSGPGGLALTPGGALKAFAPGTPRVVSGVGLLLEPASRNLLRTMFNAAPTNTAGWTLLNARPAGATLSLIDDSAALYDAQDAASGAFIFRDLLDSGVMNGMVVRADNPSAADDFVVPCLSAAAGVQYAFSAYVRCEAGEGQLTLTGGGGATPLFSGSDWQRVGRVHLPTAATAQLRLVVKPGATVLIVLAQVEINPVITSPIVVAGAARDRAADLLEIRGPHLFDTPHTIAAEFEIARQDGVARQAFALTNGAGEAMTVLRQTDNTLSATQSRWTDDLGQRFAAPQLTRWRPRLPRIYGPGRLRVAHRVSPRGRALAAGGFIAHDPFRPPPTGLGLLRFGSAPDGSNPLNGWLRTVTLLDELDDADIETLTAPGLGTMPLDIARYVSPTGDDTADGKTPETAWATLARAADAATVPGGAHIHLERGGTWAEALLPLSACTYRPYGTGAAPRITGKPFVAGDNLTGVGIDENSAGGFRVQGLHVTQTDRSGFNQFGFGGAMLHACEFSQIGAGEQEAIGIGVRGNSRKPGIVASPGSPAATGATLSGLAASDATLGGTWTLECTTGGTDAAMRWQLKTPAGTNQGPPLAGAPSGSTTRTGSGGITLTISGTATAGDRFVLTVTPVGLMPHVTSGQCEDFYIGLCHIHDVIGIRAGDDVYCEAVQGVVIGEGNLHEIPIGNASDCFQCSRTDALHVANPAHVILRHCVLDMSGGETNSGKGGAVLACKSVDVTGNAIYGHNFCLGVLAQSGRLAWNDLTHARLHDYSYGIALAGAVDSANLEIAYNRIADCNRALAMTGDGQVTTTLTGVEPRLQWRVDVVAHHNVVTDSDVGIFIDRPTSGRFYMHRFRDVGVLVDKRAGASPAPAVGAYGALGVGGNREVLGGW